MRIRGQGVLFCIAGMAWVAPGLLPGTWAGLAVLFAWLGAGWVTFIMSKLGFKFMLWITCALALCIITGISILAVFASFTLPLWINRLLLGLLTCAILYLYVVIFPKHIIGRQRNGLIILALASIPIIALSLGSQDLLQALHQFWQQGYSTLNLLLAIMLTYMTIAMNIVWGWLYSPRPTGPFHSSNDRPSADH